MSAIIHIDQLTVHYKDKAALNGLSLEVRKGEIFGFLGPNGAGKSTTIKVLLGLIPSYKGSVTLNGFPPSDPRSRAKVGFLPEEAVYYRYLSPVEILSFYGEIFGLPSKALKKKVEELLALVGLTDVKTKLLSTFSKGMAQKVSLAQALVNDPEILILDEPTSGLDPLARMELRHILVDLKSRGKTIFFSSHELSEVELVCDTVAIIRSGSILKKGALQEILSWSTHRSLEQYFLDVIGHPAA